MKHYLKFFLLLFSLIALYSCQEEDETIHHHEHGPLIPNPKSIIPFESFLEKYNNSFQKSNNRILDK